MITPVSSQKQHLPKDMQHSVISKPSNLDIVDSSTDPAASIIMIEAITKTVIGMISAKSMALLYWIQQLSR